MRKSSLLWFIILVLWIIIGVFLCWKFLCHSTTENIQSNSVGIIEEPSNEVLKEKKLGLWTFGDGEFSVTSEDYIEFFKDSIAHITPITGELENELLATTNYLRGNTNRTATIKGYYSSDEINNSILPNLGLARANKFKKYLISLGAPPSQLSIDSELAEESWFKDSILKKGINFSFGEVADTADRLSEIKERVTNNPITLYFETDAKTIELSDQQRQDFADLIYYLDNINNSQIVISGHTDNVGNKKSNESLSRSRARFVRDYIKTNGEISKEQLVPKGYGPNRPKADNNTEEGRAENRRVEVTLK